MREIKFRLWNPERNVMTGGLELLTICMVTDQAFCDDFKKNKMIWLEFTGIKDKNGKDVYEGDIVKFNNKHHEIRHFSEWGMFGMVGRNGYGSIQDKSKPMGSVGSSTAYKPFVLNHYYQKRIEVVGNIYQNKELITQ